MPSHTSCFSLANINGKITGQTTLASMREVFSKLKWWRERWASKGNLRELGLVKCHSSLAFQATPSSPGLLGLSLHCCHLLSKWLNDLSAHSAGNSVKCTRPFSDISSPCIEHHISGILGCVQCCSNTEHAADSSIPPGNNWNTNLGQVRRADLLIYKSYGRETGSAAVSAVCRVDKRFTLP